MFLKLQPHLPEAHKSNSSPKQSNMHSGFMTHDFHTAMQCAVLTSGCCVLTHLSSDKMAAISQTIFSDAFLWMKSFAFWLKFYWSLFLRVQLTITSIGLDYGLAPNRWQAIIGTNADLIKWCIYAALGEIIQCSLANAPDLHTQLMNRVVL